MPLPFQTKMTAPNPDDAIVVRAYYVEISLPMLVFSEYGNLLWSYND